MAFLKRPVVPAQKLAALIEDLDLAFVFADNDFGVQRCRQSRVVRAIHLHKACVIDRAGLLSEEAEPQQRKRLQVGSFPPGTTA